MIEMIDLAIGTRFYFDCKLFEVAEAIEEKSSHCEDCFFNKVIEDEYNLCGKLKCSKYPREDKTFVCFKEVKNG